VHQTCNLVVNEQEASAVDAVLTWCGHIDGSRWPDVRRCSGSTGSSEKGCLTYCRTRSCSSRDSSKWKPGLLFWRRWWSLIEYMDIIVEGGKIQLDRTQQHVMMAVQHNIQITSRFRDLTCIDNIGTSVMSTFFSLVLLMRTQPHYFHLGWIKSQSAGTHPLINFTDALSETLQCHWLWHEYKGGCYQRIDVDACHAVWPPIWVNRCTERTVKALKQSSAFRRTTAVEMSTVRLHRPLAVFGRTRTIDLSQHNVWQTKSMLQPLQQEIVIDAVECWRQVHEAKQSDLSCICSVERIRLHAKQSDFSWVLLMISWLG